MSILFTFKNGWLISHEIYINKLYDDVQHLETKICYKLRKGLFNIGSPFNKRKKRTKQNSNHFPEEYFIDLKTASTLVQKIQEEVKPDIVHCLQTSSSFNSNDNPLEVSCKVYDGSGRISVANFVGANTEYAKLVTLNVEIESYLINETYDLIVLDPPWWNKYIRRKRARSEHGYSMMYNSVLKDLPIENLLSDKGMVVVWCTNSRQNLDDLKNIFTKWNIHFAARWFWLKVTLKGDPVCNFSEPPGKQPFEQILIGVRNAESTSRIPNHKVIFSVPSALHSHKPPLIEVLQDFISTKPKCLELFARYLLPNWTSYGLEAIRFQHESVFEIIKS